MTATPQMAESPPICIRCKTTPSAHELRGDNVCTQCFTSFLSSKTVKRLEVLQRETRGREYSATPQRYLLALSPGGASSTALLSIMNENLTVQREKGQRVKFEIIVACVDVDLASIRPAERDNELELKDEKRAEEEEPAFLAPYKAQFPSLVFVPIPLSSVLSLQTIDWTVLPPLNTSLANPKDQITDLLSRLPSTTSRADVLRLFTRHLLVSAAVREECDVLLLGYNTTSLAELTLAETAKGRGFALPWLINDGVSVLERKMADASEQVVVDDTPEETPVGTKTSTDQDAPPKATTKTETEIRIPIYYPLREVFRRELITYNNISTPTLTSLLPSLNPDLPTATRAVVSHKDLSIDDVMARYFGEVEINYPSVVANVVRTTGKLGRDTGSSGGEGIDGARCGLCGIGLDEVGDERWRGELGEPTKKMAQEGVEGGEKALGRLCYGCDRSIYG